MAPFDRDASDAKRCEQYPTAMSETTRGARTLSRTSSVATVLGSFNIFGLDAEKRFISTKWKDFRRIDIKGLLYIKIEVQPPTMHKCKASVVCVNWQACRVIHERARRFSAGAETRT
jgi:hypothetical protein